MRPARSWLAVSPLVLIACATEPPGPGELSVALDAPPAVVATASLTLSGNVVRTPPLDIPTYARASGGQQPVEVAVNADGGFHLVVALAPNAVTHLVVTARDSTGSTSTAAAVDVRHDSRGPSVVALAPDQSPTDAPADQTFTVTFDEPVDLANAVTTVRRNGREIPFSAVLAADSLSLAITPSDGVAGAVYQLRLGGLRDRVGNVQPVALNACYATAAPTGAVLVEDPRDDVYSVGDLTGLTPTDFVRANFTVNDTILDVLLHFTTRRRIAASGVDAVFGALDFDLHDGVAWQSVKDYVFEGVLPASGVGADHAVILTPVPQLADSAFFGRYVEPLTWQPLVTFMPAACGTVIGFALDLADLGAPPTFEMVSYFETGNQNGAFADPAPDTNFYTITLPTGGMVGAEPASPQTVTRSRPPIRIPARALRPQR